MPTMPRARGWSYNSEQNRWVSLLSWDLKSSRRDRF